MGSGSNRLASLLGRTVSVFFFALLAVAVVLLTAALLARAWAADSPNWVWDLKLPAASPARHGLVETSWGQARMEVESLRADLALPIAGLPWWLVGVLWVHAAALFALTLAFLHDLRVLLRRIGAGAPFDAANALRMRRLGLVLLGGSLFNSLAEFLTAFLLKGGLATLGLSAPALPQWNPGMVLAALVLVALAETFRRGAELEYERSLVI